jgi:hypothetical protein
MCIYATIRVVRHRGGPERAGDHNTGAARADVVSRARPAAVGFE